MTDGISAYAVEFGGCKIGDEDEDRLMTAGCGLPVGEEED
jgi:hypothetical protein